MRDVKTVAEAYLFGSISADEVADWVYEQAYEMACEIDSPNSRDFSSLSNTFEESLFEQLHNYGVL